MTKFEKQMMSLTPAQRKKATAAVSTMMGMPIKKRPTGGKKKKK
jgi:hypothetical protein